MNVYRLPERTPAHPAYLAAQREAIVHGLEKRGIDPREVFPDAGSWTAPRPPKTASPEVRARWVERSNAGWLSGVDLLEQVFRGADTIARRRDEQKAA